MSLLEHRIDADFYSLVHQLVGSSQKDEAAERRRALRQPYSVTQRIAVRRGSEIPPTSKFIEVQCHDLTQGGFSFLLPSQPDFDALVAALEGSSEMIYLGAEVSYCADVLVYSSGLVERVGGRATHVGYQDSMGQTATPMVLVGCHFTERLQR